MIPAACSCSNRLPTKTGGRFWPVYQRYRSLSRPPILAQLLNSNARSYRDLAVVFYAWRAGVLSQTGADAKSGMPGTDTGALASWLKMLVRVTPHEVQRLERAYGNPRLTIAIRLSAA